MLLSENFLHTKKHYFFTIDTLFQGRRMFLYSYFWLLRLGIHVWCLDSVGAGRTMLYQVSIFFFFWARILGNSKALYTPTYEHQVPRRSSKRRISQGCVCEFAPHELKSPRNTLTHIANVLLHRLLQTH
jgi:hypothetical protein